jgi:hypothetical protein
MIEHMKDNGNKAGVKVLQSEKDGLVVETYYKGVSSGVNVFEYDKNDDGSNYSFEFAGKNPGKTQYSINWTTGRYLMRVFMYEKSRAVAAAEGSGKCELIHRVTNRKVGWTRL